MLSLEVELEEADTVVVGTVVPPAPLDTGGRDDSLLDFTDIEESDFFTELDVVVDDFVAELDRVELELDDLVMEDDVLLAEEEDVERATRGDTVPEEPANTII